MLVAFGENDVKTIEDLAGCATDDLVGYTEGRGPEAVRHAGFLDGFELSRAEAEAFAQAVGIPVLAAIPQDDDIRKKSANYQIIGYPEGQWGDLFGVLADNLCEAPPHQPAPLTQDGLLALFDTEETGADFVLTPATIDDMCAAGKIDKPSLEVVYDEV